MNTYIALAGYLALVTFYSHELSEHLRALNFRRVLISFLAVIGYGLLICHFILEARPEAVGKPPTHPLQFRAQLHIAVDDGLRATPAGARGRQACSG